MTLECYVLVRFQGLLLDCTGWLLNLLAELSVKGCFRLSSKMRNSLKELDNKSFQPTAPPGLRTILTHRLTMHDCSGSVQRGAAAETGVMQSNALPK